MSEFFVIVIGVFLVVLGLVFASALDDLRKNDE